MRGFLSVKKECGCIYLKNTELRTSAKSLHYDHQASPILFHKEDKVLAPVLHIVLAHT